MSAIVVIPARLGATRLPNKPLADIAGEPMIVHVWRRAIEAAVGRVVVAVDDERVAEPVRKAGGEAVMTRSDHPSGSDRVFEAVSRVDPAGRHDIIVNLQGDLPTLPAETIRAVADTLSPEDAALGTLVTPFADETEAATPSMVKMIGTPYGNGLFRALYFTRSLSPWGDGPRHHHIGLYAWRREALARFVTLPPSPLETREKLEQLRALEAGMAVYAREVPAAPPGVDTPEDLRLVRDSIAAGVPR